MRRMCSIVPCGRLVVGHGYCSTHYNRWRKHGDPRHVIKIRRLGTCSVDGCGRTHYARSFCRMHWERNHTNGDPLTRKVLKGFTIAQRLAHYSKQVGDCTEWQGHLDRYGYGTISVDGRTRGAHRVAYEQAYGHIPQGLVIRHKCDNPPCIDPEHLEPGTEQDNSRDKVERGRSLKFEANPSSHLTNDQALAIYIRAAAGEKQRDLAREVGQSTVSRIVRGDAWAGLTGHHVDA